MNLSTSNFNYKNKILLLISMTVVLYAITNVFALLYDHWLRKQAETHSIYVNDTQGKYALLKKLYQSKAPDIIFIGNSYTQYNVSTHHFAAEGIPIFNYGVRGYFIAQLPKIVKNAIKLKPKIMVLSMVKPELFTPFPRFYDYYDHQTGLTLSNLAFLAKHANDYDQRYYLAQLIGFYFYSYNYFPNQGYKINKYIADTYHQIEIGHLFNNQKFANSIVSLTCDFDAKAKPTPRGNCYNGDMAMPNHIKNLNYSLFRTDVNFRDESYDLDLINIVNSLFDQIRQAGIQPVLVLVPAFYHHITNDDLVRKTIRADVIDMSDYIVPKQYWYDDSHFNAVGRNIYTHALEKRIKPLLANKS